MHRRPTLHRDRKVWAGLLASLALHLLVAYLALEHGRPEPAPVFLRTRLPSPPLFETERLSIDPRIQPAPVEMEYLPAPPSLLDIEPYLHALLPPVSRVDEPGELLPLLSEKIDPIRPFDGSMGAVELISPAALGLADTLSDPTLDLLSFADRARAMKDHAVVVIDPASRRDLTGYINFAQVRLPIGALTGVSLEALARYMNDHTRLLVGVQPKPHRYFLSLDLLKDPILFLLEGISEHEDELSHRVLLRHFRVDEKELLEHYLRSGGFLFVEGSNRYLHAMIAVLREVLQDDGRLLELGPSHPIYHSFYSFPAGFRGEDKSGFGDEKYRDWNWDYPGRVPGMAVASLETVSPSGFALLQDSVQPAPVGLWGLELNDELVAVFSDLELSADWSELFGYAPEPVDRPVWPSLRAGTNIVVYALTRSRSLAVREPPAQWVRQQQRPMVTLERETADPVMSAEVDLLATLDASLAIARAPLGNPLDSELVVRLNGRRVVESSNHTAHGLLLYNLPAGPHWLEVEYDGRRRQLQVELEGGRVSMFTVAIDRIAWVRRLTVLAHDRAMRITPWREEYADLLWEESYLTREQGVPEDEPRF